MLLKELISLSDGENRQNNIGHKQDYGANRYG